MYIYIGMYLCFGASSAKKKALWQCHGIYMQRERQLMYINSSFFVSCVCK